MRVEHRIRAIWYGLGTLIAVSAAASLIVPSHTGSAHAAAVAICTACHDGVFVGAE